MSIHQHRLHQGSLFSVSDVRCDACASGRGGEEHAHTDQLVLVRGGVFVKHVGRRELVADATRAVFFNRGVGYRVSYPVDGGDRCTMIVSTSEVWRELLAAHDPRAADRDTQFLPTLDRALSPRTVLAHQGLAKALRESASDTLRAEEMTFDVAERVLSDVAAPSREVMRPRKTSTRRAQRELVERTKYVLSANPAMARSLPALARDVCSSPFHLSRVFRREVGVPIHQYLTRLRLSLAVERLFESKDSLTEIALTHGFASHSHFTTAFRQTFGVPPSVVRRGMR